MKKYVIYKSVRGYEGGEGYGGPTCDRAGIPHEKLYESQEEAQNNADRMTKLNPVGFEVARYYPRKFDYKFVWEVIDLCTEVEVVRVYYQKRLAGYKFLFPNGFLASVMFGPQFSCSNQLMYDRKSFVDYAFTSEIMGGIVDKEISEFKEYFVSASIQFSGWEGIVKTDQSPLQVLEWLESEWNNENH